MKILRHRRLDHLLGVTSAACWLAISALAASGAEPTAAGTAKDPAGKLLRDAALMLLKEGNVRYAAGKSQHPNLDAERRSTTVAGGQEPFASILACADSRGPVELVFDRGIGDLFVVRVAGNIAGDSEVASLEYGVGHLNTPVLVVLGHSKCGAVTAVTQGAELQGHLHVLAERIEPAAQKARAEATGTDDLVPRAIQANVWNTMERILRESSVIREKAAAGSVHLVGAVYDLETGRVAWFGGHPAQDAIIALANQATTDAALAGRKESFATNPPDAKSSPNLNAADVHAKGASRAKGLAGGPVVEPAEVPNRDSHPRPEAPTLPNRHH